MKKYLAVFIFSTIFWSCGGGGGGDNPPDPTPVNKVPTAPSLTEPTNNLLCINNTVSFKWTASTDPDGDPITYTIELSKNSQFSSIETTTNNSSTATSFILEKGIAYYWRVKAIDNKNASSSYSSTFQFYTEGEGTVNHLPFAPELVKPSLNLLVQENEAVLEWNASDVDTEDTLTYDVYFGTENPPTTKVSNDNYNTTTYTASLSSSSIFYWKVNVKDDKGGITKGQVWSFKTD